MPDPASILGLMADVIAVATFVKDSFARGVIFSRQDLQNILQAGEESGAAASRNQASIVALRGIDPNLLDAIEKRIRGVRRRLRDAAVIFDPRDLLDESQKANEEICLFLQIIKSNNGGTLPTQDLDDMWAAAGCT